jgi:hypothetical protein
MFRNHKVKRNSQFEIVDYLETYPCKTEKEIQEEVWGYIREESNEANKKYADILRRALQSGKIKRIRCKIHGIDKRKVYRYYVKMNGFVGQN